MALKVPQGQSAAFFITAQLKELEGEPKMHAALSAAVADIDLLTSPDGIRKSFDVARKGTMALVDSYTSLLSERFRLVTAVEMSPYTPYLRLNMIAQAYETALLRERMTLASSLGDSVRAELRQHRADGLHAKVESVDTTRTPT